MFCALQLSSTVVINARCSLRIEADQRVIVVAGLPVHHYRAVDRPSESRETTLHCGGHRFNFCGGVFH
jgi:hypothetical protein